MHVRDEGKYAHPGIQTQQVTTTHTKQRWRIHEIQDHEDILTTKIY